MAAELIIENRGKRATARSTGVDPLGPDPIIPPQFAPADRGECNDFLDFARDFVCSADRSDRNTQERTPGDLGAALASVFGRRMGGFLLQAAATGLEEVQIHHFNHRAQ